MYMPEDLPEVFALFVDWLYRCSLPTGNTESYLTNLYFLWIFATKICEAKLADTTMDRIQDTCKDYDQYVSDDFIKEIWELTQDESPLRCWMLDLKIYKMSMDRRETDNKCGVFDFIKDKDEYKTL